jgi:cell wall-associated NlpC family hydrolase
VTTRWRFTDPVGGDTYTVPINPNTMTSPFRKTSVSLQGSPHGEVRALAKTTPVEWSFGGVIRTQAHYDALLAWTQKPNPVTITDHLGRTHTIILSAFNPEDARAALPTKWNYTITGYVLSADATGGGAGTGNGGAGGGGDGGGTPTTPATPTGVTGVVVGDGAVTVTWTAAGTAGLTGWVATATAHRNARPVHAAIGYGPLYSPGRTWDVGHADDGTRQEGSDWSDFLGISWTYPNGQTDAPEVHQLGCLDCSGYVRMVYGRDGGIPLTTTTPLDGSAIPRVSYMIAEHGPGVIVAHDPDTPPALDQLQVGDILCWDADTGGGEEEGQVDHVGIYMGVDSDGNRRFVSSRKTINGPTLADVGGPSIIDGAGLYAVNLRTIRRF